MGKEDRTQAPLNIGQFPKRESRTQFAALCYRTKRSGAGLEILLLTSRDKKRWVIPKGWPMDGKTPAECAAQEAFEEGGVKGRARDVCIGLYPYTKSMGDDDDLQVIVNVFPMEVQKLAKTWPEDDSRKRKWFPPKKAASKVDEPELKTDPAIASTRRDIRGVAVLPVFRRTRRSGHLDKARGKWIDPGMIMIRYALTCGDGHDLSKAGFNLPMRMRRWRKRDW